VSDSRESRLATYRQSRRRYRPDRRQFERLVADALDELPEEFRSRLSNVAIVVEDWPPSDRVPQHGTGDGDTLLGLYEGTPLSRRGTDYHLVPPDRITIYRGPILALCETRAEVIREVHATVVHEVGHFFGLDEHELK
jgi:predicted Zn-dependent protease with MMP-like domain